MSGNRQWYLLNINICTLYIYIFEISSILNSYIKVVNVHCTIRATFKMTVECNDKTER